MNRVIQFCAPSLYYSGDGATSPGFSRFELLYINHLYVERTQGILREIQEVLALLPMELARK